MLFLLSFSAVLSLCWAAQSSGPVFVGDSPQARILFYEADTDHDGLLTKAELHGAFLKFDKDNDTHVSPAEFLQEWKEKSFGTDSEALRLFTNLDVNRDSFITEDIDMPYIMYFFDRNGDELITEGEFVIQWVKISS